MPKPNFICIGVQKAGTTSLIKYLNQHPKIYLQDEKHFFDKPKITLRQLINYEKSFRNKKPIRGEKTPSYCYLKYAMNRIYRYKPNIKLILILREPIKRAWSQYNMDLNININNLSEDEIITHFKKQKNIKLSNIKSNGENIIVRGYYDNIISNILSNFPRKNIKICISEEIKENKKNEYNKIFKFLGTHPVNKININCDTRIGNYKKKIPEKLEKMLYNIYKKHNQKLYKILGRKINKWEEYYEKFNI